MKKSARVSEVQFKSGQWGLHFKIAKSQLKMFLNFYVNIKKFLLLRFLFKEKLKYGLILDVGCGSGKETVFLSYYFSYSSIIAIDVSKTAIKMAKNNRIWKNTEFIIADCQFLPIRGNCFDAIYSADVFAHIPNLLKAVSELSRVSKIGAKLAIYSETSGLPCMRKKIIKFLSFDPWVGLDGHISLYSFKELASILESNGLLINEYCFYPDTYGIIIGGYDSCLEEQFPQLKRKFRYRFLYGHLIHLIFSSVTKYVLYILYASIIFFLINLTRSDKGGVFLYLCKE